MGVDVGGDVGKQSYSAFSIISDEVDRLSHVVGCDRHRLKLLADVQIESALVR